MSQQLPPGIHRQGFDAAVQANAARPDASGVELRTYAGLTPEFRVSTRRFKRTQRARMPVASSYAHTQV
jgi:hypothetical protein